MYTIERISNNEIEVKSLCNRCSTESAERLVDALGWTHVDFVLSVTVNFDSSHNHVNPINQKFDKKSNETLSASENLLHHN